MKKNVTYVDAAKFEAIIQKLELSVQVQKGFVKCIGPKGRQVYVPLTKTVGRVDVSGFTYDIPGVITLAEPVGAVMAQLDFSLPEDEILAAFEATLEHMKTLEPREIIRKARAARESGATGWSFSKKEPATPASPADAEETA